MQIEKLIPEYKDYIWGGNKLKTLYNKQTDKTPCAESWELSFHKDGLTRLENGKTLLETVTEQDLGNAVKAFSFFPVLIKFIDAKENLSVQVHPDDEYALKTANSLGKTEMWYVVEAEDGAGLYLGFNGNYTVEEVKRAIDDNTITDLLRFYPVKAGEAYFIPAGTVHAIGKGCLICEIQQNSNITYRFYDYGRGRQLHLEQAFAVSKFEPYQFPNFAKNILAECKYFSVEKLDIKSSLVLQTDGSTFHCLTCVNGSGFIDGQPIALGDSYFVPANYGEYRLEGNISLIKTSLF